MLVDFDSLAPRMSMVVMIFLLIVLRLAVVEAFAKALLLPIDVALPKVTTTLVEAAIHASRQAFPEELGSLSTSFYEGGDWDWLRQKMLDVCPVLSRENLGEDEREGKEITTTTDDGQYNISTPSLIQLFWSPSFVPPPPSRCALGYASSFVFGGAASGPG